MTNEKFVIFKLFQRGIEYLEYHCITSVLSLSKTRIYWGHIVNKSDNSDMVVGEDFAK